MQEPELEVTMVRPGGYYTVFPDSKSLLCNDFTDEASDKSPIYIECDTDSSLSDGSEDKHASNSYDYNSSSFIQDDQDSKDAYIVVVSYESNTKIEARFHCCICNIIFNSKEEIDNHFIENSFMHTSFKKCEICYSILDENAYDIHMKLHKEHFKQRNEKNKLECKICGKIITKTYLKFHMKKHGSLKDKMERLKTCPVCFKSVHFHYFSAHMKRMHEKVQDDTNSSEKTVCPICDRQVKDLNLELHIAGHGDQTKIKQYQCEICGKVFKSCSSYRTHELTHTGNLKYKCQFCPYRGLHLGLLKIHVRTHTKDYSYKCSICEKKFITKSNLSMHAKRHNPPEFNCSQCCKAFYTQRKLDEHIKLVHLGIKDVKCDLCCKSFGHKSGMYAHQRRVHNVVTQNSVGRIPTYLKLKKGLS